MPSPWIIAHDDSARARNAIAHETVTGSGEPVTGVRRLVQESWERSLQLLLDPDRPLDGVDLEEDELRAYRDAHPLSLALPTIHRLLIRHTFDAGLIVEVGDQDGRLLWIDGDRTLRR